MPIKREKAIKLAIRALRKTARTYAPEAKAFQNGYKGPTFEKQAALYQELNDAADYFEKQLAQPNLFE